MRVKRGQKLRLATTNRKVRYSCTFAEQNLSGGNSKPEGIGPSTSLSGDKSKGLLDLGNSEFSNTLNGLDRIKNESESQRESFLEG